MKAIRARGLYQNVSPMLIIGISFLQGWAWEGNMQPQVYGFVQQSAARDGKQRGGFSKAGNSTLELST